MFCINIFFFFFSSRRRHTRYIGDWSSDVCSSDLKKAIDDADLDIYQVGVVDRPLAERGAVALTVEEAARAVDPRITQFRKTTYSEIGRASCRERVLVLVVDVAVNRKRA